MAKYDDLATDSDEAVQYGGISTFQIPCGKNLPLGPIVLISTTFSEWVANFVEHGHVKTCSDMF